MYKCKKCNILFITRTKINPHICPKCKGTDTISEKEANCLFVIRIGKRKNA